MRKRKQLEVILKTNPMQDDYHVGIRTIEDIMTFQETVEDKMNDEYFDEYGYGGCYGDFEEKDVDEALACGKVVVYSSRPIIQANFISTSKRMAEEYAGRGHIYSKYIDISEVAWINIDEGMYIGKL